MGDILVTGSNGFIGKNILEVLTKEHHIIGIGRREESRNICDQYIRWDLGHEAVPDMIKSEKIDYIIHAAARLDKDDMSDGLVYTNCVGTFNIVKFAKEFKVKGIIYLSSLPVIGYSHSVPINEMAKIQPPTMYHATKASGELIVNQATHFGVKVAILRIPSPVGPGMPVNTIVPVFVQRALRGENIVLQGEGKRKQNYLDVRDIGSAVKRIIEIGGIDGIFNIGAKNILSNKELADLCVDCLNSKSRITLSGTEDPFEEVDWTTDDSKLRNLIGDYQKYTMASSIIDIASKLE